MECDVISSVIPGDTSFFWECQKFDPYRTETLNLILVKFDTVDYIREETPYAKFC